MTGRIACNAHNNPVLEMAIFRRCLRPFFSPAVGPPVKNGTMKVQFNGCNAGVITYNISSLGLAGEIPIERIVLDNVALCELLGQQAIQE
jgi:hypothetical protein